MTVDTAWLLWLILLLPVLASAASLICRDPRRILLLVSTVGALWAILAIGVSVMVVAGGSFEAAGGWLFLDKLSAYQLLILALVYGMSSVYARGYFLHEHAAGHLTLAAARRYGALWFGSITAMSLVLSSNNLGIMWVGIEATTLTTGFLITIHTSPKSLEAMWKYLLVCSVGVAFAFVGTLMVAASAHGLNIEESQMLSWTALSASSGLLNPALMKLAFIFLLVGYGTKAGLAPMHSWLPDAHSQAPAPVSALFSGAMLNTALYCIIRYIPLVEGATGNNGWGLDLLLIFGLVSIIVSSAFIIFQSDGKRLLAYHSVEHIGIITLGLGLGGLGIVAALWHTLNHSVCKALSFFAMGRLGQAYGTHDLEKVGGAARRVPLWGFGFFISILILIGVAPFSIFMSEFMVLRASIDAKSYVALGLFLLGTGVVFIAALKHALDSAWGHEVSQPASLKLNAAEYIIVAISLSILLVLGLWLPEQMLKLLEDCAQIVKGGK